MLIWNLFFFAKILLWWGDKMQFLPLANAGLLLIVLGASWMYRRSRLIGVVLNVFVVLPLAIGLVLKEVGMVLTTALLQQIQNLLGFSQEYLLELLGRTFPAEVVWGGLALLASLQILNRYFRLSTWTALAVLAVGVHITLEQREQAAMEEMLAKRAELMAQASSNNARTARLEAERISLTPDQFAKLKNLLEEREKANGELTEDTPNGHLNAFFKQEAERIHASYRPLTVPDFDVIFLHVCSLAWADLEVSMQKRHPLLDEADLVFNDFNTAASYSGPATIRFLRGNCGQPKHESLYSPIDDECALFNSLSNAGFSVQMGMNHDGIFDDFKKQVIDNLDTTSTEPVLFNEVSLGGIAFDGSELGRDSEFLKKWWDRRVKMTKAPVAMYYNSITLHDGNLLPNSDMSSLESYPIRLERLLNDLKNFIDYLKESDRKALVVLLPEHGAGMSGEYGQLKGLRELPTPAITKVPVLAYWISNEYTRRDIYKFPIEVNKPTSYRSVTEFLSRWIALPPPQRNDPRWPLLTSDLPGTPFVAQQDQVTVMRYRDKYMFRSFQNRWQPLKD
ncbi:MAG: cellulose biosynthesis protein BcsG [Limnobacter sp.]|nr:cellulose biosynthesis protein BcsG [Limnobacter sp.]